MRKLGWLAVTVLCASLAIHNAARMAPTPLIEEFRARYDADYASVGTVIGAYTVSYAVSQLVAGLLADRLGNLRLIKAGLLLMALGSGIFAFTADFTLALVGRFLMGIAGGLLYVPALSYRPTFARSSRSASRRLAQPEQRSPPASWSSHRSSACWRTGSGLGSR